MYLDDTTLAPAGSWRKTRIEYALICDIACAIAQRREGSDANERSYHPEAERMLRLFIAKEGRYPADCLEVEDRFPGCFERGITLRVMRNARRGHEGRPFALSLPRSLEVPSEGRIQRVQNCRCFGRRRTQGKGRVPHCTR
jgi:hypothetical protein